MESNSLYSQYIVNNQSFFDLIRIRYGWQLDRLPSKCEWGSNFSIDHALSCKKGGFVLLRHKQVRNLTASLLSEVYHDVCVEPELLQLTEKMSIRSDEARVNIAARSFWVTGQMAFFDVRVFNPIAKRYVISTQRERKKEELQRTYIRSRTW